MDPVKLAELQPIERATAAFVVRVCRAANTLAEAARGLYGPTEEGERTDGTKVRRAIAKVGPEMRAGINEATRAPTSIGP